MEDGSPEEVASAIGDITRSKDMSEIARKTGFGRLALYNALSEKGNPTLETLMSVVDALGLQLTVQRKAA
jgi:probable addiction module antidote protein